MNNSGSTIRIQKGQHVANGFKTDQTQLADLEDSDEIVDKTPILQKHLGKPQSPIRGRITQANIKDTITVDSMLRATSRIEQFLHLPILSNVERITPKGKSDHVEDTEYANCLYIDETYDYSNLHQTNIFTHEQTDLVEEYIAQRRQEFEEAMKL